MVPPVQFITDENGDRTAVVLTIADYRQILEDIEDLADIVDRGSEPTIPHEEFPQQLKADGTPSH
jgi:hypothetical protein